MKKRKRNNYLYLIIIGILLIGIISGVYIYSNNKKVECSYPQDIAIKKMQFDFFNAVNGYPYNQKQADFAIAVNYVRCK